MRTLTLNVYQVVNDELLLVDGEPVIVDTIELEYDEAYTAIAGAIGSVPHLYSFDVLYSEQQDEWRLFINKQRLVGRYSSRPQAIGVLVGLYTRRGVNSETKLTTAISHYLASGVSSIATGDSTPPAPVYTINTSLWSVGTSIDNQNEPYYRTNNDIGPDNVMQEAIDSVPGNPRLLTLYPDKTTTAMDSPWYAFTLVDLGTPGTPSFVPAWDGDFNTLPQIDPSGYVTAVQDAFDSGYMDGTPDGLHVLLDWEYGTTTCQKIATTYWNDEDNPQFKVACTELRRQLGVVYDTLKAAFPNTFFGQYGATCDYPNGNLRFKNAAQVEADGGTVDNLSYNGLNSRGQRQACSPSQLAQIDQNALDAMDATRMAWDYTSVVCYDIFGADAIAREAAAEAGSKNNNPPDGYQFASTNRPAYRVENSAWSFDKLQTKYPSKPSLGIISPSNVAKVYNYWEPCSNVYGWATPADFVDVTIATIKEADGYLIWDNLLMDQEKHYLENYNSWANVVASNQDDERLEDWSMMESMESRFGYMTAFKALFPASIPGRIPTTPQEWFDETIRSERQSPASKNLFVKYISESWRDEMIPMLEEWKSTGLLPYVKKSNSTITGSPVLGGTLTAAAYFAGDATVDYRWRRSGSTTNLGTASTYTLVADDIGGNIECRVRVRRLVPGSNTIVYDNETVTVSTDVSLIANDFGGTASGFAAFSISGTDQLKFTTGTFGSPVQPTAIIGSPMSIPFSGGDADGNEMLVDNDSTVALSFPDGETLSSVMTVSGSTVTLPASATLDKLAAQPTGTVIGIEVTL